MPDTFQIYQSELTGPELDEALKNIRQLEEVSLTSLSSLTAKSGNKTYDIAENAQVLLRGSGRTGYYAATLSEINAEDFSLKGWYDNFGCSAGGQIRIIVATPREA